MLWLHPGSLTQDKGAAGGRGIRTSPADPQRTGAYIHTILITHYINLKFWPQRTSLKWSVALFFASEETVVRGCSFGSGFCYCCWFDLIFVSDSGQCEITEFEAFVFIASLCA